MRRHDDYPITISFVKEHPEMADKVFLKKKRHSFGMYLGVCLLQGCNLGRNTDELYSSLAFGDELVLKPDEDATMPISVFMLDGTQVGFLTYTDSLFPMMLMRRGIAFKSYVEAVEYNSGILSVAVSLYFERY